MPPKLVVPPALVVKDAALTVEPKVVVPVVSTAIAPKALVLPTAPVKVTLPLPALMFRSRAVVVALSTVLEKLIAPFEVVSRLLVKVVSADSKTAPLKL